MVEQSGSFALPGELVRAETAHVNFGRENNVRQYASASGC